MLSESESFALAIVVLSIGSMPLIYLLRLCVNRYAFYGMSKTRRKKIIAEQSALNRIFMIYAVKYNYPARTWWCLICYYVFCVSLLWLIYSFFIVGNANFFFSREFRENIHLSNISIIFLYAFYFSPLLSLFSIFVPLKSKKK